VSLCSSSPEDPGDILHIAMGCVSKPSWAHDVVVADEQQAMVVFEAIVVLAEAEAVVESTSRCR